MDVQKFEKLCNDRRLTPVHKVKVGNRTVFIADGYLNYHPTFTGPHYQTVWAVGQDADNLEIARPLYFSGVGSTTKEQRIAAAAFDGIAFAEVMNGRSRNV